MNQREKGLAGCLVGVIVAYGGYTLIKSKVYQPRQRLTADISAAIDRRERLQNRLGGAAQIVRAWQEQTRQTLHSEGFAAHQAFREEVESLLKRNNLTEDLSVKQPSERRDRKGAREGFVELPLTLHTKGKLDDLVNFLKDYYQRPYLVRVDKLKLRAEKGSKSSSRKAKGGTTEPKLDITMTLSTLVLPKAAGVEHPTINLAAMNDPESEVPFAVASRLQQKDPVAYNEIAKVNFFKIYEPPPAIVKKPLEKKPSEKKPSEKPSPPVRDPRRDADKFVLEGMGWLDDGPIAYVINTDDAMQPPEEYRLNDEVDDGKLVLIVPEGIVVRVLSDKGQRQPPKNYFYPLGATFKEREEVNPAEHPGIARTLRLVLKK